MTDTPEDADRRFLDAITEDLRDEDDPAPIVTAYVVLATWIDNDGDQRFYGIAMHGQTASTSLGLIGYGEEHERELMRRSIRDDLED
jgi:hypothetical protein